MLSLDTIGPRKWKEKEYYIQVAIDHFSRFMVTNVTYKLPTTIDATSMLKDNWVPYVGCSKSILTDRGSICMSQEFQNYVINELQIKLFHTSAHYPQGNGTNESSHKSLDYILKTLYTKDDVSFEDIVGDVVLIYNNTPHGSIGETPYFTMFGIDCIYSGFSRIISEMSSEVKILHLKDRWKKIYKDLNKIDEKMKIIRRDFNVGDIISYELSDYERKQLEHYSVNYQYKPYWSFPYRVTKVNDNVLQAIPVYYRGKEIQILLAKVKLLSHKTREIYENQLKNLIQIVDKDKGKSVSTSLFEPKSHFDIYGKSNVIPEVVVKGKSGKTYKDIQKDLDIVKKYKEQRNKAT